MKLDAHLILVSAQPIPNLTPMLDEAIKPQKVLMLVSPGMRERAIALEKIFRPRGIAVEILEIDDPWDADGISDTMLDVLSRYPEGNIALNATGGTKLMSIASYEAFRSENAPIYYVHPEQDRLLWLSPKHPSRDLADRLKLREYLMAYGADQVDIPDSGQSVPPVIQALTEDILADIERYSDELGMLNFLALQADNPRLSVEIEQGPQSRPMLWELLERFEQAGICRISGHTLQFPDQQARFVANGGWLEMHTYKLCTRLKKPCAIQDLACNITIQRHPAGKTPVKNEIDIGLIRDNRLYLIECKTKRFEKEADVLYKLDSLRDLMGGLHSRAMLVSFNTLNKAGRARAKELKIALCCKAELRNLQPYLQTWLAAGR